MTREKRKFEPDYKLAICKQIREIGLTVSQICTDNNLRQNVVYRWLQQYDDELNGTVGANLPLTPEQRRIRELEKENKRLKGDVDILKKAMTCFIAPTR